MASPPSPPVSSASVSRSKSSRGDLRLQAEEMLRASISCNTLPASVSRSKSSQSDVRLLADEKLRASVSRNTPPASVSRSRFSRGDLGQQADEILRASVSRNAMSASVSRSSSSQGKVGLLVDEMLRTSVSRDTSSLGAPSPHLSPVPSSASIAPPAYSGFHDSGDAAPFPPPHPFEVRTRSLWKSIPKTNDGSALRSRISPMGVHENTASDSLTSTSAAQVKLRMRELQREVDRANAKSAPRPTVGLFKATCSTDLLFLIDTTGSMGSYIDSARQQVRSIVHDIKKKFLNESEVRVAVVGYKDHADTPNIQLLDFTLSTDEVSRFLDTLYATGGDDAPEDVLGGVQKAINASWEHQTRCIIHIADAPAHGRELHDLAEAHDNYIDPGSEPHRLTYVPLLKQLIRLKINYTLLRITPQTDRMALAFSRVYAAPGEELHLFSSNAYYSETDGARAKGGKHRAMVSAEPQFEELQLGTIYSALANLVVSSVTSSISRTATRLSTALSSAGKARHTDGRGKTGLPDLFSIEEHESTVDLSGDSVLEKSPPQWDVPGWLDETLTVEGFWPDVVMHGPSTLNDMMDADANIKLSLARLTIQARSRPFAEGEVRIASYARTAASTTRFVIKSYKEADRGLPYFIEDMRIQALCKAFALEFNGLLKTEYPIDFIATTCLESKTGTASGKKQLSLEPFIEGDYIKYNNNNAYVNEDIPDNPTNMTAQAFSHFTFERSWGHFLVNDLQGVGHVLTDPSIQTSDSERFKLNDTNLGKDGFKFFFATHECNHICHKLQLETNREMFISGDFSYRERWPTLDPTICCSNKLCQRIVRLAKAHQSDKYPGHNWCDRCWPQLRSSTIRWLCVESSAPKHEFDVSRFFHESQGEPMPRKCPDHRERDKTVTTAAVVGGSLWSSIKSEKRPSSVAGRSW